MRKIENKLYKNRVKTLVSIIVKGLLIGKFSLKIKIAWSKLGHLLKKLLAYWEVCWHSSARIFILV